jgi:hypothetical protein
MTSAFQMNEIEKNQLRPDVANIVISAKQQ